MPKSEAKINQTKQAISNGLKELLLTKPLSKITVNDIAEVAGVTRGTAYRYYNNIYDILLACAQDYYVGINRDFKEAYANCSTQEELCNLLYDDYLKRGELIKENPYLFTTVQRNHDMLKGNASYDELNQFTIATRRKMISVVQPDESRYLISADLIAACMLECCDRICMQWVLNGFKETTEEIARAAADADMAIVKSLTGATAEMP